MRNIIEQPITKQEIEDCLIKLADDLLIPAYDLPATGDLRPTLLYLAARIVKESNYEMENLKV
jgi:hypothetical protein